MVTKHTQFSGSPNATGTGAFFGRLRDAQAAIKDTFIVKYYCSNGASKRRKQLKAELNDILLTLLKGIIFDGAAGTYLYDFASPTVKYSLRDFYLQKLQDQPISYALDWKNSIKSICSISEPIVMQRMFDFLGSRSLRIPHLFTLTLLATNLHLPTYKNYNKFDNKTKDYKDLDTTPITKLIGDLTMTVPTPVRILAIKTLGKMARKDVFDSICTAHRSPFYDYGLLPEEAEDERRHIYNLSIRNICIINHALLALQSDQEELIRNAAETERRKISAARP